MPEALPELLVIAGPTASGKSALAMQLAQKLATDIISGDSMQFYRTLNIGVAKPTLLEQQQVKHHLIDILDIQERVDVFRFLSLAEAEIAQVSREKKLPMVVGGTGMYLKALLYGLDDLPGDVVLRAELDEKYDNDEHFDDLKKLMQTVDPQALAKWHQHRRKLIRALEVITLCGKSITLLQQGARPLRWKAKVLIILPEREALKSRIALRTKEMLADGWIAEAEAVLAAGLLNTPTAHQALGYDLIGEYLAGKLSLKQLEELIITKTWQFARRQITWFKNQHPEAEFLSYPIDVDAVYKQIDDWRKLC